MMNYSMTLAITTLINGQVEVRFEHGVNGVVVCVMAATVADAIVEAVDQFRTMQAESIKLLERYGLLRLPAATPLAPKVEPS